MPQRLNPLPVPAKLEPWDQGAPALHGPARVGGSARKPFFHALPATGERPLRFTAEGLPAGLRLDPETGHLSGAVAADGEHGVLVRAANRHGAAERELALAFGRGLALTPPLGWNSWNAWRKWVSDANVRAAAAALVRTGLAARGYAYVNLDSCWQGDRGGPFGAIQPNRKFPDLGRLAADLHAMGLKFGLYSTPWVCPWGCGMDEAMAGWGGGALTGCSTGEPDPDYRIYEGNIEGGKYVGRHKHESADVAQWAAWGVDFLKYDWTPTDPRSEERMGRALQAAPRDIVLSICTNARLADVEVHKCWSQLWRGTTDTRDDWNNLLTIGFFSEDYLHEDWRPHVGPGRWHDLDMLALGPQADTETAARPNRFSPAEQITAMTRWALHPSPLLLSCDLAAASEFELALFGNEEVLAVNQDVLGKPSFRFREERVQAGADAPARHRVVHVKPLDRGCVAVGVFNLGGAEDRVACDLRELGFSAGARVRDAWERRDLGRVGGTLNIPVAAHGAQLLTLAPA
jgi:alpha-galactosidase